MFRLTNLTMAGILVLSVGSSAFGQFSHWTGGTNGAYGNNRNWTPQTAPRGTAVFGTPGAFNVSLAANAEIDNLSILRKANVGFRAESKVVETLTYSVADTLKIDTGSLAVGATLPAMNLTTEFLLSTDGQLTVGGGSQVRAGTLDLTQSTADIRGTDTAGNPTSVESLRTNVREDSTLRIADGAGMQVTNLSVLRHATVEISGTDTDGNPSTLANMVSPLFPGVIEGTVNVLGGARLQQTKAQIGRRGEVNVIGGSPEGLSSRYDIDDLSITAKVNVLDGASMYSSNLTIGNVEGDRGELEIGSTNGLISVWLNDGETFVTRDGSLYLSDHAQGNTNQLTLPYDEGKVTIAETARLRVGTFVADRGFELDGPSTDRAGTLEVGLFAGDLQNKNGTVSPGPGSDVMAITGTYRQLSEGILDIDIFGAMPGDDFDVVNVEGLADLDGELQIGLGVGYVPSPEDSFSILHAGDIVGQFANAAPGERISTGGGRGSFQVNYGLSSPFGLDRVVLSDFEWVSQLLGDFNNDGERSASDIDLLSEAVSGSDLTFDLTADGMINELDRIRWVEDLKNTYFGDSNFDGEFNSGDLVQVFVQGEYEDSIAGNSSWSDGDWNGDGDFDSRDFVLAFTSRWL